MDIVDIQKNDLNDLGLLFEELSDKKSDKVKMLHNYENMINNGQYYLY